MEKESKCDIQTPLGRASEDMIGSISQLLAYHHNHLFIEHYVATSNLRPHTTVDMFHYLEEA
jgi:hypothetical protein